MKARGNKKNYAHHDSGARVKSRVELGSLVMLRDDGTNEPEWHESLDLHFQSTFGIIGYCLTDPNGYHIRTGWSDVQYAQFQADSAMTNAQLSKYRIARAKDLWDQREKDNENYAKMFGVVKSTITSQGQRLLQESPTYAAIELAKRPLELVTLVKSTIVTSSVGRTATENADTLIRRWQKLKCGERELADDFVQRAEQLWNALTAANHPEKPALAAAIRFVTKLLVANKRYIAYVADVLNDANKPTIAGAAYATTFPLIATAARNFRGTGTAMETNRTAFAYACSHCDDERHSVDNCWKLHPELRPGAKKVGAAKDDKKESSDTKADDKTEANGKAKKRSKKGGKGRKAGGTNSMTAYATLTEDMAFGLDM